MAQSDQPIHKAAQESAAQLKALLDHELLLRDEPGQFGRHPIHFAARAGRADCVDLLLQRGASPNARDGLHRWTPLHDAVAADSYECVDNLLRSGAAPNAADAREETPIFYAKSLRIVQRLNAAGADLRVISGRGQYPFQYCAAYVRSLDVIQDQRFDMDVEDTRGDWLWRIVETVNAKARFRETILATLQKMSEGRGPASVPAHPLTSVAESNFTLMNGRPPLDGKTDELGQRGLHVGA